MTKGKETWQHQVLCKIFPGRGCNIHGLPDERGVAAPKPQLLPKCPSKMPASGSR